MAIQVSGVADVTVVTATPIGREPSAIGGVVARARFYDALGSEVISCDVTALAGNGDIRLSSVNVAPTQAVELTALSYAATQ